MSGHSKWSKIKRQKGIDDQRRGEAFSKFAQAITLAVQQGKSGDPEMNASLRLVIEKARAINMPRENIDRAIARGLGSGAAGAMEQVTFEGYGPAGVAMIVSVTTDNRNRTLAEVRSLFEQAGGSLGAPGSAAFLFEQHEGSFTPKEPWPVAGDLKEKVRGLVASLQARADVTAVAHTARFDD